MPKVIGEDGGAVKQVTCRSCAARLEYTPSELQRWDGTDYTGGSAGREWVKCPRCGHEVVTRSW